MRDLVRFLAAAMIVVAVSFPGFARADQGVAINLGAISIDEPLDRGESYRLPDIDVSNPGSEDSVYRMSARPVSGSEHMHLEPGWFTMHPLEFELSPGDVVTVSTTLQIPPEAQAGRYEGLIGPSLVPEGGGAAIGAGAAAKISFEVTPDPSSLSTRTSAFMAENGPLVWIGASMILVIGLAFFVGRRFTLRVERR
jgi:hypothetical protein